MGVYEVTTYRVIGEESVAESGGQRVPTVITLLGTLRVDHAHLVGDLTSVTVMEMFDAGLLPGISA